MVYIKACDIFRLPAGERSATQVVNEKSENSATSVILRVTVTVPDAVIVSVALKRNIY